MVVGFAIGERIQLQDYTTASWIGWSWLLLDEPISRSVLIGLIVVVGGLVLAPPVSAGRRAPPLSGSVRHRPRRPRRR